MSKGSRKLPARLIFLVIIALLVLSFYLYKTGLSFPQGLSSTHWLLPGLSSQAASKKATLTATVIQVSDGDTVHVKPRERGNYFKCRLYGIDAPETSKEGHPGQKYADAAKEELESMVLNTSITVTLTGEQSYDREICLITDGTLDVNLEMIKRGYAWAYRRHLKHPYAVVYTRAEEQAKRLQRGLWKQNAPEAPWHYRGRMRGFDNLKLTSKRGK